MNTQEYWKRRTLEREQLWNDLINRDLDRIIKFYYEQSLLKIQKDIAALYAQFAVENKLSMSEAKRLIRGSEFSQWRMTLQEYVKAAKNDSDILKELNTLAMRSRISRIEALHARTMMEVADLCEKMNQWENSFQYRAYIDHLYGNLYDYHKTIGLNTPPVAVDKKHVENILTTPWIGKNYSQRIWKNGRKLERAIQTTMIQAIHRGYSIQKLSKNLSERMEVGYHNAERLVRTELNYIENRAAFDAMKDADLEFYQFVATLDNRTTPMCQSLDGRVFPLEEKNQGENAPPMHVRCRSTIIGSLDDGKSGRFVRGSRAAKDENGKRIKIPADMNYNDWKKVYIDKTQSLADWRKAKDAEDKILREKDKNSKIRVEGREIIKKLANGENVTPRGSRDLEVKKLLHNEFAVIHDNGNRNKYTVNFDLMNSKAYHDKFENLSPHKQVNESLYKQAAKILSHRSGTEYEDIAMIDARTGKILAENNSATGIYKFQCGLTYEQNEKLMNYGKKFEILHNHPNSSEPSTADIVGLFSREYAIASTVVCHDGTVYRMEKLRQISNIEEIVRSAYSEIKLRGYPESLIEFETVELVIETLEELNVLNYRKVT